MRKLKLFLLTFVALLGAATASGKTVYIQPNDWTNHGAVISLNVWVDGSGGNTWATLTEVATGILKATFDDSFNKMAIVRGKNANVWKDDGGWNQSADLDIVDGKLYSISGWDGAAVDNGITLSDYTEPVAAGYTVDFNTTIATSDHAFAVASNWGHIVDYLEYDYYGTEYAYVSYNYNSTAGKDGTGALYAYSQHLTASYSSESKDAYDLLVTPLISGTVTIDVKAMNYSTASLEIYAINDGAKGDLIKSVSYSDLSTSDYTTISFELASEQKVGLRLNYVYIDNFTASSATILPEPKLTISAVTKATDESTVYFNQQADGSLLVQMYVTLQNQGEIDFVAGTTENYTLSVLQDYYGTKAGPFGAFAVPVDLAKGETSEPILVEVTVPAESYSSLRSWGNWYVIENVTSTQSSASIWAGLTAYESKFVFREAGSTSSASAQSWGTITESTTKSYEIANTGTAPMTITAITLPEGFTSDNAPEIPAEGLVVAGGETVALNITNDASTTGTFAGTLTVSYIPALATEATDYTLAFSVTVISANTWTADFNGSTSSGVTYPVGAIAESGISTDNQYISSGNYNIWLTGRTTGSYATENNKFITPKLHANAGDQLAFDAKAGYSSTNAYYVKVYVSTDRVNWGDPVAYYTYSTDATLGSEGITSAWTTKTITFDTEGDYYVAFALYGTSAIDNLVGLEKVDVAHDLYIKSVSWPDASIKSGTAQSKPSVDIIPLTNEAAENYTVKYIYGENEVAIESKALTASASSTTSFTASFTPEVEETTTFPGTKVVFEFTDGTKFETETFDLTVTNEPIFHFQNSKYTSRYYEPSSDYSTPYSFGKTNEAGASKTFWILNWGSVPLTVKSIAVPEGFTTSVSEMTLPAFDGTSDGLETCQQSFDVTFSATEAGTYSGNLVITYVNGAGEDATFELALSGTMLDPSKFYANFGAESNQWPAGSVYQSNVSTTYVASGDYAITSSSTTNNLFITPKLTAAAGEKLLFDAKLYSTYWNEGQVVVYAAATREELVEFDADNDTRNKIFSVSGSDELTTDYKTFEIPAVAGDNYYAFEISGRPYVDEIYGLTQTAVAHDWALVSSNIPAEGMQNNAVTATVNVANFGVKDEAAEDIQVIAYLNGEAVATAEGVAIPMSHQLSAAGTQLSVTFRSPKAGTFPVYLEVKAGDYSVATDPVDVVFAEEIAVADAIEVGASSSADRYHGPIDWYNADGSDTRWTDIVYTAEELVAYGITAGSKITSIAFHGSGTAKSIKAKVTSWVGMKTGDITPHTVNKEEMTEISVYDQTETAATIDFSNTVLDLSQNPIVYDGTSDIRIYTETVGQDSGNWQTVTYAYDNNYKTSYFNSSDAVATPLGYFTLAAEPAVFAGTVANAENATVTLVSADGDNIQYEGTTDSEGAFSINVIQSNRTYNVTVSAEGYETATVKNVDLSQTYNFSLFVPKTIWTGDVDLANWANSVDLSTDLFAKYAEEGGKVRITIDNTAQKREFTNNANWANVYLYAWDANNQPLTGAWPGTELTEKAANGNYTFDMPANAVGIIFNGGEGSTQTYDITELNHLGYYTTDQGADTKYWFWYWDNTAVQLQDAEWATIDGASASSIAFGTETVDFNITADVLAKLTAGDNIHLKGTAASVAKVEVLMKAPKFDIVIAEAIENGTVSTDLAAAKQGATVTITLEPNSGFEVKTVTVTGVNSNLDVEVVDVNATTYTFVMPNDDVTVNATFATTTGISNFDMTNTVDGEVYNAAGIRSDKLTKGQMNIIRTKDGKVRKVVIK